MSRLVHLYASNRLKIDVIIAAKNNLSTLNLASGGHLADENLDDEADPKQFNRAVGQFYARKY